MNWKWYEQREESLRRLKVPDYATYLQSRLWKAIRRKVFRRAAGACEVCGNARPEQVHHRSYCLDAMLGKRLDYLVACCRPCHEQAEFDHGVKLPTRLANASMAKSALRHGRVLYGLCHRCRHNPTKEGHALCGKCKRLEAELEQASRDANIPESRK